MSGPTTPADLLDLKMMPAWVNEPARTNDYSDYEGEEVRPGFEGRERRGRGPQRDRGPRPAGPARSRQGRDNRDRPKRPDAGRGPRRPDDRRPEHAPREAPAPLPQVGVKFLPHPAAFESVIAQIKSGPVTYSVFALARMFLDKPERYNVHLTAAPETPLHQLGEAGAVAADVRILEGNAFASAKDDFYNVEVVQSEPIKGNFSNVARDRVSGTLLGPTNHHQYQPQLRSLYEQRYSRRMSFQEFQRQIEIVSDPAVVEQWKEQARSVTTFTTKNEDPPQTFHTIAEAERHFRQQHLPNLLRTAPELTVSGVVSRRLPDRALGRVIENAWSAEMRSPSKMMQELAGGLRGSGLNIFRHRRGMLFVSPVRLRAFDHERASVSASINAIMEKLSGTNGVNRKQLAEQLVEGITDQAEIDRVKLSLASDLRWLISEGNVIEFNDGTLDLPRAKVPPPAAKKEAEAAPAPASEPRVPAPARAENVSDLSPVPVENVGGMAVEQTVEAMPAEEPPAEPKAEPAPEENL